MTNEDVITIDDYRNTEFHFDWVRPQFGYVHELGTIVEERDGLASMLMVCRTTEEGRFQSEDRLLLSAVSSHLQRAFAIRKHILRLGYGINQLAEALDDGGLIGIDRLGQICDQRGRLLKLLLADGWISIVHDHLRFREPSTLERIMGGLRSILEGRVLHSLLLPFDVAGERLTVELMPAPVTGFTEVSRQAVVWVLFRGNESLDYALRLDRVARQFDWTVRERDVAALLIKGRGVRQAAIELRISYNTARSHVKSILHKAGINRQSALAGLAYDV